MNEEREELKSSSTRMQGDEQESWMMGPVTWSYKWCGFSRRYAEFYSADLLCAQKNAPPSSLAGLKRRRNIFVLEFHQLQEPSVFPVVVVVFVFVFN